MIDRTTLEQRLQQLIRGEISREDAAFWAGELVRTDATVETAAVWNALVAMSGADLISTDRPYLHGPADFQEWLRVLRDSE